MTTNNEQESRAAAGQDLTRCIALMAEQINSDMMNLLTEIVGYAEMALERMGPSDSFRTDLEKIRNAGVRATAAANRFRALGMVLGSHGD